MHTNRKWSSLSIRGKAAITQLMMIIVPVCLCTWLIMQQITTESRKDNAMTTYEYDRYLVTALDTSVRQLESMSNTIAGNKFAREYVSMPEGEERDALYQKEITNLLLYAHNRYLPTHDIRVLPRTSLADIDCQDAITYARGNSRLWVLTGRNEQLKARYCHQFMGNDGATGVLVFTPALSMLTDPASTVATISGQKCAVFAHDGTPLYIPSTIVPEELALIETLARQAQEGYSVIDDRYMGYCIRCEVFPAMFVAIQEYEGTWQYGGRLVPLALLCLLLIAGCIFISYRSFFSNITKRILKLSRACESLPLDQIGRSRDGARRLNAEPMEILESVPTVPILGNDEIGRLSDSINDMLRRIAQLTVSNEQALILSQQAAYDMLAAQIHPHFIYNTLENLRMMAEMNDDEQVADLLYALGQMLRLSISDSTSTGNIGMEIEHVQMYLKLQEMRMNGTLTYQIDPVPPEILQMPCPRFLLQPIAENAIKHGLRKGKTPGCIHISSGVYDKGIYLRVHDGGVGLTEERLQSIREALAQNLPIDRNAKGGIGLHNVHARLRMFYGPEAGLTLDYTPGEGTLCTLWLANCQSMNPASSSN